MEARGQPQGSCLRRHPPCSFETTASLTGTLGEAGWPGSPRDLPGSTSPSTHHARLFTWVLGSNSSLQAYMASAISPAPVHIFEWINSEKLGNSASALTFMIPAKEKPPQTESFEELAKQQPWNINLHQSTSGRSMEGIHQNPENLYCYKWQNVQCGPP